ncbi:MAG: aliphatic sulfonate ABC transporter substrate-binding protein [Phycisphaerales bacterium]|jgi:NitT/TauT family transport system substrate-binding protein|nr:aliphatic sulfonate ABC transporter substrate-binding protein [Phycisphaerales bacterium]
MRQILFIFATLFALPLVGCNSRQADNGPLEEVRLGYFPNLTHAQAVLGVASGDFSQAIAPIKLTAKVFNAGPSLIEALLVNEIDIGYVGPGPALTAFAKSQGEGIRIIAGGAANGVVVIARAGAGIIDFKDLKDKRLATPQIGNTQDISARHYLKSVLGEQDLGNILPISNSEQAALMQRGEIDAAWVPEPWGARLMAEAGGVLVGQEKDLWPDKQFTLTVVVTTPEFLVRHRDVVEKMLRVHRQWTQKLSNDPQKYLPELESAMLALNGRKLPAGVLRDAIGRVEFTDEPLEKSLEAFARWSYELEFFRRPLKLDGLVDVSVLRQLQQSTTRPAAKS